MYQQWEKDRLDHIQLEIERNEVEKIKAEIEKTKAELEAEDKRLFFFDNEEKLELDIIKQEEKMKSVVTYKAKGKHKEHSEDVYIPPDVQKKKN